MKKTIALMMIFGFVVNAGFGQSRVRFRSTEWVGLSTGQSGNFGAAQTVDGVAVGSWFLGAGAGLDYYRFRSVPLFASLTKDFALGKLNGLFLYADGGTNLPWYTRSIGLNPGFGGIESSKFHSGAYWSGGLGYLWRLGEHSKKAVLLSAGYTVKKLSEDQVVASTCAPLDCDMVHYEYAMKMYQFMIGFRF